jgi:hypothetical protein
LQFQIRNILAPDKLTSVRFANSLVNHPNVISVWMFFGFIRLVIYLSRSRQLDKSTELTIYHNIETIRFNNGFLLVFKFYVISCWIVKVSLNLLVS